MTWGVVAQTVDTIKKDMDSFDPQSLRILYSEDDLIYKLGYKWSFTLEDI